MKICTYNVNSIRARQGLMTKWLDKRGHDLDVLCLQELKAPQDAFPRRAFSGLGFEAAISGQPRYNGVAICAKNSLEEIKHGFGESDWDDQKRVISCKVDDISIVNLYAPHGEERGGDKYFYKINWYARFLDYLKSNYHPEDPILVVGDFNVALENRDVYDPRSLRDTVGTMPEERKAMQNLLDWGLVDVYRHMQPEPPGYTWWSYLGGSIWKDEGMRIDYILCTQTLRSRIINIETDLWPRRRRKPVPSDHAPVIAELVH